MERPALNFAPEQLLAAQGVRIAFFDVDGVLTDGGLYLSEQGEALKRFHILDGLGLKLLQRAGITPAVISGRDSKPLRSRLQALGIAHVHYGTEDKRPAAEKTLHELGLQWSQAAAIGDDWPDLPLLRRCAGQRPRRSEGRGALRDARCGRQRRGARILRFAASSRRALRRTAERLRMTAAARGL